MSKKHRDSGAQIPKGNLSHFGPQKQEGDATRSPDGTPDSDHRPGKKGQSNKRRGNRKPGVSNPLPASDEREHAGP